MKNVNAKFFRDGEKNMVELSVVSSKDTVIKDVKAQHLEDYPKEWEAYSNGAELVDYGGTPLTQVPGITGSIATNYKLNGIHNAEMLADIPDIACKNLGMGALAARTAAKNLVDANKANAAAKENEALKVRIAALEAAAQKPTPPPPQQGQRPQQHGRPNQ